MKQNITFSILGFAALALIAYGTKPFAAQAPGPLPADIQAEITSDALDVYLSRLVWAYECTGACAKAEQNKTDFRIIDSNGLYSYGCLQFQEATYLAKASDYGIDPSRGRGIYDCQNQWAVARAMFLDDPVEAASHWYTSVYKRGLGEFASQ